jgi:glutamate-1-semialdehyde 2,1-aminomutase
MKNRIRNKLLSLIPGGAHTYSRGYDQFPYNSPEILLKGKGSYIFDNEGNKFLDFSMGLRSVNVGYSEDFINRGAIEQINYGNNLSKPSLVELRAAKQMVSLIKSMDMVKFTKNGSSAVTAAVKLSRAYTNKNIIIRCSDHPFFSYDDWFIGSTVVRKGIPEEISRLTLQFKYNDISALKKIIKKFDKKIAAVVLEPATRTCPIPNEKCCGLVDCKFNFKKEDNFLKQVRQLCSENKIVMILDEMITGFRWDLGGAQEFYGVKPDISTFGKAMANGFSLACVGGKRKIMELGSIEFKERERVFLLSTTYGAEMSSLGAFLKTVEFIKKYKVIKKNWETGKKIMNMFNSISKSSGLKDYVFMKGFACTPVFYTLDNKLKDSLVFRTLLLENMIKSNILLPNGWLSICYRHSDKEISKLALALEKSLFVYKKALMNGVKNYLKGDVIKPVFRRFN